MTAPNKNLPLATPDFDEIKNNLKVFLSSQEQFKDFDFDGSAMSTLLDVLAYNTHFNAFYLNMVGNESFLSTAARRSSVVSRAKSLGYTPQSATCARATIYFQLYPTGSVPYIDVPRGTKFTARSQGNTFDFTVNDSIRVMPDSQGRYIISSLELIEGKQFTHKFVIASEEDKRVIIPNMNVDASLLNVTVCDCGTSTDKRTYTEATSLEEIDGDSRVYFISESSNGLVELQFGDGVLGTPLMVGNEVEVEYYISSGEEANGVASFSLSSTLTNVDSYDIHVISPAVGGDGIESIESIKYNAPYSFETQNRAVTPRDYELILKEQYSNISDIKAWGGEDAVPPKFGFVFIAINPQTGFFLTESEKERVKSIVKRFNVATVTPTIVDADFTFANIDVVVYYDDTELDISTGQLRQNVIATIEDYSNTVIGQFDKSFRYSALSKAIDNTDTAIVNNNLETTVAKRIFPQIDVPADIDINFSMAIDKGTLSSSRFTYNGLSNCLLVEGSIEGQLDVVRSAGNSTVLIASNIGSIDYDTGEIFLPNFEVDAIQELPQFFDATRNQYFIKLEVKNTEDDIHPVREQIVVAGDITVNLVAVEGQR